MRRLILSASLACAFAPFAFAAPAAAGPATDAAAAATAKTAPAKPVAPQRVKLTTTDGVIVIELDRAHAPITVDNFIQYVKDKHFDGTIFHRVKPGFMIQGGGFTTKYEEKPTRPPIKLEAGNGLTNVRGAVAMARTPDLNSATSQFFINLADNSAARGVPNLDRTGGGYAVFGMVIEGMDVVDKLAAVPTGPAGPFEKDVPFRPEVILKAELVGAASVKKPAAAPAAPATPAAAPTTKTQ